MLDHRGQESKLSDEEMEGQFHKHLAAMKPWLVRQPNMDVLYVNYNALIAEPEPFCDRISDFLGISLNQAQMLAIPDQQLYRNRAPAEK
jgi:Sulfotransferase domain